MVDHGRCREPSMCFTTHTQRMLPQVRLAEPLPLAAVATLGGRRSVWVQGLVLCTVQAVCQIGTAWVLAGLLTFLRHKVHLRIQKAASDDSMAALVLFFAMIQYSIP